MSLSKPGGDAVVDHRVQVLRPLGGSTCLMHTASFVLRAVYSVKDHLNLTKYSPLLKKTCVRQVVSDKWFPLRYTGTPNSNRPMSGIHGTCATRLPGDSLRRKTGAYALVPPETWRRRHLRSLSAGLATWRRRRHLRRRPPGRPEAPRRGAASLRLPPLANEIGTPVTNQSPR